MENSGGKTIKLRCSALELNGSFVWSESAS